MSLTREQLQEAAEKFGTPLFVYDADRIAGCYRALFDFIRYPGLKIHYAMKANYNVHILQLLQQLGASIDAVSPGDVLLAQRAGFPIDRILFTANNMTETEMAAVHQSGVLMNIGELSRLEKFGRAFPGSRVCIRFNPDVRDGDSAKTMTGGDLTKFGILLQEADHVRDLAARYNLKVVGLHEHTGSGLQHTESVFQSMKNLMAVATPERFPDLEFLDFGGGFKVPYHPDEARVDYVTMGAEITRLFTAFCRSYGRELGMYFEPGKYMVAESGYLLMTVNTIKDNNGRLIAGCNSGFPQLIRPVLYNSYHHILNLGNPDGTPHRYDVCGNICETGDLFAEQRELPEIREGDLLAIANAGAYCYSMGSCYNLRPMPAEAMYRDGQLQLVRRRLSNEELVAQIIGESLCPR
ncbi:MAG: diaminopimelate decarboxylase [Victivallales bacterium]|nr:diaminopimelate decarboxylase [Victivallales bacterium]